MTTPPTFGRAVLSILLGATVFSGIALEPAAVFAQPIGAPVLNNNQPVLNTEPTVTLVWAAPTFGSPIGYVVEAASAPGGPPDLANFFTGNTATSLVVPGVPPGIYYVRVRAVDAALAVSARSNEVQVVVGAPSCPGPPRGLAVVSQNGGTITIGWLAPMSGTPSSYVVQAGSAAGLANLANFDTASTALTLAVANVPPGSYYVRVYSRSSNCAPPAFLGPASNEILLTVGNTFPGWSGAIVCRLAITGPSGYHHDETQTWNVGGPSQTVGPRTNYPVQWSAQGAGGGQTGSWTIDARATTDFSVTTVASTGLPLFDRTSDPILILGGIVGTPTSFDLREIEFPGFTASSPSATSVSGNWSRATVGGDSPQQPGGSTGTLSCTWSLTRH
jgi:hypothetical protein